MTKARRHIKAAALLMLSIMLCLNTIKAVHYHTDEECNSWEHASNASYESVCYICLFTASLVYDLTHEYSVPLHFFEEMLVITVIQKGHSVPFLTFNLRAPPVI